MCIRDRVPAAAGGVAYSRDPVAASRGREQILLNAVAGLPQAVVDGAVTPDVYVFSREIPPKFIRKRLAGPEGTPPSLTDSQAAELAKVALALESYYTEPQDVDVYKRQIESMPAINSFLRQDVGDPQFLEPSMQQLRALAQLAEAAASPVAQTAPGMPQGQGGVAPLRS